MKHYVSGDRRPFTSEELESAAKLKLQRIPVTAIAERMNRNPWALYQVLRNPPALPIDVREAVNEAIIQEFYDGSRIIDIARKRGWTYGRVENRLAKAGIDGEMRALIRAEFPATQTATCGAP